MEIGVKHSLNFFQRRQLQPQPREPLTPLLPSLRSLRALRSLRSSHPLLPPASSAPAPAPFLRASPPPPSSLPSSFFGLHRIKPGRMHLLVMTNMFDTDRIIHERYDLKGSTLGRAVTEAEKRNPTVILKDLDFLQSNNKLVMGLERKQTLLAQLQTDTRFLETIGVMDYSLLLGVHWRDRPAGADKKPFTVSMTNKRARDGLLRVGSLMQKRPERTHTSEFQQDDGGWCSSATVDGVDVSGKEIYFMGIIDYLQYYNSRKRAETFVKSCKYKRETISAVPPGLYARRFCSFMGSIIE